jgi:hypothetical protein
MRKLSMWYDKLAKLMSDRATRNAVAAALRDEKGLCESWDWWVMRSRMRVVRRRASAM